MKYDKFFLRKQFLLKREKKYLTSKKFNFHLIFSFIKKHFNNRKISVAGYYPSNYEANILNFLREASKKKFKIALPVIKTSKAMVFKSWTYGEPLYVNSFGILEPKNSNSNIIPDLILVPLVAYDNKLNRIGYGKGYYDRSLKSVKKAKKNSIALGVSYSFQRSKNIPVNKHDFKLDYIFTERGIISQNTTV